MVYVTRETGRSFGDVRRFLSSRITRIYPLWWVCAGIIMVYFWVTYGIPAAPDRIAGPHEAVTYALKSLLLIPQDAPPILGLGWTLIHEMFFYLVFALILFLPKKYLLPALIAWALLTVAGSFLIRPTAFGRNIPELMASPFFRFCCIPSKWSLKPYGFAGCYIHAPICPTRLWCSRARSFSG